MIGYRVKYITVDLQDEIYMKQFKDTSLEAVLNQMADGDYRLINIYKDILIFEDCRQDK